MKEVILLSFILLFIGACEKNHNEENRCAEDRDLNSFESSTCEEQLIEGLRRGFYKKACYTDPVIKDIDYIGPIVKSINIDPKTIGGNTTACNAFYEEASKKCNSVPPTPKKMKEFNQLLKTGIPKCSECLSCEPIYVENHYKENSTFVDLSHLEED